LTPKIFFSEFIKRIFGPGASAGFGVGQVIALPPKFASLTDGLLWASKRNGRVPNHFL